VSTRRGARNTKSADSIGTSAGPVSRERLDSRVAMLAIEKALAELGIHAPLSNLLRRAQSIETAMMQSRSHPKPEHLC
jgi:hypothetical protein